jgi:hypothetical protein
VLDVIADASENDAKGVKTVMIRGVIAEASEFPERALLRQHKAQTCRGLAHEQSLAQ